MTSVYDVCFYGGLTLSGVFLITAVVLFFVLKIPKVIGDLTGSTARRKIREMKAHAESITLDKSVTRKEQAKYYNVGTGKITVKESKAPAQSKSRKKKIVGQVTESGTLIPTVPEENIPASAQKAFSKVQLSGQNAGQDDVQPSAQANNSGNGQPLEDITEVLGAGRFADTEAKTEVLSFGGDDLDNFGDGDAATEVLSSSYDDDIDDYRMGDDSATDVLRSDVAAPNYADADYGAEETSATKKRTFDKPVSRPGFTVLMDVMLIHTQDTI
ncbi:MAG: hypothetical protein IKO61_10100 [Lachnospiraceae bacterium]|nr:hypothetical protein [Lachnospiraceae bacterium]